MSLHHLSSSSWCPQAPWRSSRWSWTSLLAALPDYKFMNTLNLKPELCPTRTSTCWFNSHIRKINKILSLLRPWNQFPNPRLKDRLSPIWFYTNSPHSWKLEVGVFFHDKEIKAKIDLSHWSDVLEEYHTNVANQQSLFRFILHFHLLYATH